MAILDKTLETINALGGPQGTIQTEIINRLPGGTNLWLMFFAIITAMDFAKSFNEFRTGTSGGTMQLARPALLAMLFSWIAFGNTATSVVLVITVGGMVVAMRAYGESNALGSMAEVRIQREAGFNTGQERRIVKTLRGIARSKARGFIRKIFHKETQQEKLQRLRMEEEALQGEANAEMQIHEATIAAGSEHISNTIKTFLSQERSAEDKEKSWENMITHLDDTLKNLKIGENRDDVAKQYAEQAAEQLKASYRELVQIEKEEGNLHSLDDLGKTFGTIEKATKRAKNLDQGAIKFEHKLSKIGSKEIHALAKFLEDEQKHVDEEFQKARLEIQMRMKTNLAMGRGGETNALKTFSEQYRMAKENMAQRKQMADSLYTLDRNLKSLLVKFRYTLMKLRKDLKQIIATEHKADGFKGAHNKASKEIVNRITSMQKIEQDIESLFASLSTERRPEVTMVKLTTGLNSMFSQAKSVKGGILAFEKDELYKFISEVAEVLKDAHEIENSLQLLGRAQFHVIEAYKQLDQMVIGLRKGEKIADEALRDISAETVQEKITVYEVRKGEQIKSLFKNAYNDLAATVQDVAKHVEYLQGEFDRLEELSAKSLAIMQDIANVYFKRTKTLARAVKQEAKQALSQIGTAKFENMEARMAA